MARQILKGGDLGNWGDAFAEGRKQRDDELYRKAMMDLEAQKFAEGRYAKPTKNEYGLFGGFEDDVESMKKDLPIVGSRIPWARPMDETKPVPKFSGVPGASEAGTDDMTSLINKLQKMSGKQVKMEDMVAPTQRAPQSQPMAERPLLANPKEQKQTVDQTGSPVKLVGPAAQADKVVADESKAIQGVSPEGRPQTIIPASETTQEFKSDLNVTGSIPESPAVEPLTQASREPSDFNPSRSYLTRLAEYSTTGQTKETQPQVAVGNLPVEWQRIVLRKGPNDPITPQEQAITIPADMIKAVVEQSYKPQAAKTAKPEPEYSPELAEAIGEVESGIPVGTVARKLAQRLGRSLKKNEMEELRRTEKEINSTKRATILANQKPDVVAGEKLSPAQKKVDETFAKFYAETLGGVSSPVEQQKDLEIMSQLPDRLKKAPATGARGLLPEGMKDVLYPQMQSVKQDYEQIVAKNLRKTIGAQFAASEADQFFKRAYNDRFPPEENARRIRYATKVLKDMMDVTNKAIKHFETNGTMRGFRAGNYGIGSWDQFDGTKSNQGANQAPATEREKSAKKLGVNTQKIDQFPLPGQVPQPGQIVQYNGKPFKYIGPADGDRGDQKNWEAVK